MITLFHAIQSLVPGAEVSVGMYDKTIIWHKPETAPVTAAQILEEQQRLQQAYDWNMYQRNRAREYPSVQEQLDALYHAGVFPAAMADRIRAVKEKYPRHPMGDSPTADPQIVENSVTKLTVEQWLEQQSSSPMTREQWLASQQQSSSSMTREQWLASQQQIKTPQTTHPQMVENSVAKMTVDQWLAEETKMTDQEWLAQQQSARPMTREQWLASQQQIKTTHAPTLLRDSRPTMTAEEWLAQQTAQTNEPMMTREQWLEQQKTALQPRQMTREQWLAEQTKIK
jgi:hypothetical protein